MTQAELELTQVYTLTPEMINEAIRAAVQKIESIGCKVHATYMELLENLHLPNEAWLEVIEALVLICRLTKQELPVKLRRRNSKRPKQMTLF